MTVDISEIQIAAPNTYVVVLKAQSETIKATFEVEVRPRRRNGWGRKEINHPTQIEKLEAMAREMLNGFCQAVTRK